MSSLSAGSDMQNPALNPHFMPGPPGKVPGRKRGRPPIRKLDFQSRYVEPLLPLKVPKKRGRKPGFKVGGRSLPPPSNRWRLISQIHREKRKKNSPVLLLLLFLGLCRYFEQQFPVSRSCVTSDLESALVSVSLPRVILRCIDHSVYSH